MKRWTRIVGGKKAGGIRRETKGNTYKSRRRVVETVSSVISASIIGETTVQNRRRCKRPRAAAQKPPRGQASGTPRSTKYFIHSWGTRRPVE